MLVPILGNIVIQQRDSLPSSKCVQCSMDIYTMLYTYVQ